MCARKATHLILYFPGPPGDIHVTVMDKFWSICTMPIGVAIVLIPAAVVWWFVDRKKPGPDDAPETKKS